MPEPTPSAHSDRALLQVTEEEFVAGFHSVYRPSIPAAEWAADLPAGAFAQYESRGAVIPEGEFRAVTLPQLHSLETLIHQVLEIRVLTDDNTYSATHGQTITWPMANM